MSFLDGFRKRARITINYSPHIKESFFDRDLVKGKLEKKVARALWWWGSRVREKARSYIGKPNVAGTVTRWRTIDGKKVPTVVKRRRTRPAPKPPIARVDDTGALTLRNIQYNFEMGKGANDTVGTVRVFGLKFPRARRQFGKSAPEVHEVGGKVSIRGRLVTKRTKSGKPSKRKGQVQRKIVWDSRGPAMTFKVPKRPIMRPIFQKTQKEFRKRLAAKRFG